MKRINTKTIEEKTEVTKQLVDLKAKESKLEQSLHILNYSIYNEIKIKEIPEIIKDPEIWNCVGTNLLKGEILSLLQLGIKSLTLKIIWFCILIRSE